MERKTGFEPTTLTLARCLISSTVSRQVLWAGLASTERPPNPPGFCPVVERSTNPQPRATNRKHFKNTKNEQGRDARPSSVLKIRTSAMAGLVFAMDSDSHVRPRSDVASMV